MLGGVPFAEEVGRFLWPTQQCEDGGLGTASLEQEAGGPLAVRGNHILPSASLRICSPGKCNETVDS